MYISIMLGIGLFVQFIFTVVFAYKLDKCQNVIEELENTMMTRNEPSDVELLEILDR